MTLDARAKVKLGGSLEQRFSIRAEGEDLVDLHFQYLAS
jgi:hypothetical protein